MQLAELIARYRRAISQPDPSLRGATLEFELRRQVHRPEFRELHERLLAQDREAKRAPTLTHAVTVITGSEVRRISFVDGRKAGETYYSKRELGRCTRPDFAAVLAAELPRTKGEHSAAIVKPVTRLQSRLSFQRPPWRIELTIVQSAAIAEGLQEKITQMFSAAPTPTPDNMLERLTGTTFSFEVEAELVSAQPDLSESAVLEIAAQLGCASSSGGLATLANILGVRAERSLRALLPQVVPVSRERYAKLYPPTSGLFMAQKTDGVRGVIIAKGGRATLLTQTTERTCAAPLADGADAALTVIDGEFIAPSAESKRTSEVFLAFDVLVLAGRELLEEPFERRQEHLANAAAIVRRTGVDARPKRFVHVVGADPRALERTIRDVHDAREEFPNDGLIIVLPGKPYAQTVTLKWKSLKDTTLDFLVRRAPEAFRGQDEPRHELHWLFVGITPQQQQLLGIQPCPGYEDLFGPPTGSVYPMQFAPSDDSGAFRYQHPRDAPPIDGKIVEMRRVNRDDVPGAWRWELVRVRTDRVAGGRDFGNNVSTAEDVWVNYMAPFELSELWTGPATEYFAEEKSAVHAAMTAAISIAKGAGIKLLAGAHCVVDLGAGKGQDLGRYMDARVKRLVAIDRDAAALAALVRRKYTQPRSRTQRSALAVSALVADMNKPHAETEAAIARLLGVPSARDVADAVVCHLAVHYALASTETLANFVDLCATLVRPRGSVRLIAMLGDRVHALLRDVNVGEAWRVEEGGRLKYALRRDYSDAELSDAGQKIGVLLPFSRGELYEEYLVNPATLVRAFTLRGFTATAPRSLAVYLPEAKAQLTLPLTAADEQYISLYGEFQFTRNDARVDAASADAAGADAAST